MTISRRRFLQFAAGAAAGSVLTPIPWKLMDDVSIWTQNWPWVPVPAGGPVRMVKSACGLCPGGCAVTVRMVGERLVRIEGDPADPVSNARLCPQGLSGLQYLYGPRFTSPMKRTGPRGSGQLEPISWDEALGMLAGKLEAIRAAGKPHTLACISGDRSGVTAGLFDRFLTAFGSPNALVSPDAGDSDAFALGAMQGVEGTLAYDLENAGMVLSFGAELLEGWGTPARQMALSRAWNSGEAGGKPTLIQISSRLSVTASQADEWIPVTPGTEAVLALGLAHVMVRDGVYDMGFVRNSSIGFENWISEGEQEHIGFRTVLMNHFGPDEVSRITGVEKGVIEKLATRVRAQKRVVAVPGTGTGNMPGPAREFMAVHSLNALLGALERPGGVFTLPANPVDKNWPAPALDATARTGAGKLRVDGARRGPHGPVPGLYPQPAGDEGAGYGVEVLMVLRSNPFYATPGLGAFLDKAESSPFIVSFGSFIDETSMAADLILPEHHPLERLQENSSSQGTPYRTFRVSPPVVKPLAQTKEAGDAIIETARRLGSTVAESFPWATMEEALMAGLPGLLAMGGGGFADSEKTVRPWDVTSVAVLKKVSGAGELKAGLKKGLCWVDPAALAGKGASGFGTLSGKFEFYSGALRKARPASKDEACLPGYEPMASSQRETLSLIVYDDPRIQSGGLHASPYMTKIIDDTVLLGDDLVAEIHPETAAKEGVAEGERVEIRSSAGAIEARLHLFEGVMPGIVLVPAGLGHRACGRYLEGRGANPGEVVEIKRDPVSGLPVSKETRVRLTKV